MALWMCPNCGSFYGSIHTCPKCKVPLEIVGFPKGK